MVQRRAARYVTNRFHNISSVTDMITQLQWESLSSRRTKARLIAFYKIHHNLTAIASPSYVIPAHRPDPDKPHKLFKPYFTTDSYRLSFFPRTIDTWNNLPPDIATRGTLQSFKIALDQLSF